MQRKDIKAGEDYFYQRSRYSAPDRYRVVTTEPRVRVRDGEFAAPDPQRAYEVRSARGSVLVQRVFNKGTVMAQLGPETLVSTRELKGPWDETMAAYRQAKADAEARTEAAEKVRERALNLREAAQGSAKRRGLDVTIQVYSQSENVTIPASQLLDVLAALPDGWRYQSTTDAHERA